MKDQVITLPERPAAADRPPLPARFGQAAAGYAGPKGPEWQGSGAILVVDDEEALRIAVTHAVTRLGFTATAASGGAQAIALFKSDPGAYALVLMDLRMPGIDSEEITRVLRLARPDVPVVIMSGLSAQEALARTTAMGATEFLHKPFTMVELASTLRAALRA